jgi:type IV secretion system protein VirB6
MAGFTMGADIFGSIDDGLKAVFDTGLPAFAELIGPLIGAFVSLYAVIVALNWIWSGNTSELPIGDLLKRMFYMALFTAFAFNISLYTTAVVGPVNSMGEEIAGVFATNSVAAPNIIDQMGNQVIDTITMIWDMSPKMSITDWNFVPIMRAIGTIMIVGAGGVSFMAVCFLYLLIAKIMVSFCLLIGPLYISFAFFPVTREYFMKWAGQLLNYVLLYAMFGIGFTLLTNLLQKYVHGNNFEDILISDLTQVKLLFCYVLFIGVMMSIPALTSQLTGGVGISGLGTTGGLLGGVAKGMKGLTKGLGDLFKKTGNQITGGGNKLLG